MSIIGTVSNLVGRAVAVKADGSERELAMGDQVFADELIRVSPDGSLEIAMETGEPLLLEGGQSWLATADTYQDSEQFDTSEAVADVESIQAAILAGADPTEVAEETAAGGEGEAEGNEGSSFVQVEATREEVDPTAGYETGGIADAPSELPSELQILLAPASKLTLEGSVVNEGDGTATITAIVDNAPLTDLTITLSTGDTITILTGQTSGSTEVEINNEDDIYLDGEEFPVSILSTDGGNYESLDTSDTASVVILDTIDNVNVSLSATPSLSEGDATGIEYTVTLTGGVANNDITVTLDNGEVIVIPAGDPSASTFTAVQGDDVYLDGETVTNSIVSAVETDAGTPGALEDLTYDGSTVDTVISDTEDTVTVSLSATPSLSEGDATGIEYTVTLTGGVANNDITVTLDNGEVIVIPAGDPSASTFTAVQGDDVYLDGETVTNSIVSAVETDAGTPGALEDLTYDGSTVDTVISDTEDTVTVSLSATPSLSEGDATGIEYTVTLTGGVANNDITVTLDNGEVIVIPAGDPSASTFTAVQGDDVYLDGETVTNSIVSAVETDAGTPGALEDLTYDGSTVDTVISDTEDTVTVSLSATPSLSEGDATGIEYTVTLTGGVANNDITVTLDNGEVIVIPAGDPSASTFTAVQGDDVYLDGETVTNSIVSAVETDAGTPGALEDLTYDGSTVDTVISDTEDTVTATLATSTSEIAETGGSITYTVTLSGTPGGIDPDADLVFTLTNPDGSGDPIQVTVLAGSVSGQVVVTYSDAEITTQTSIDNSIASFTGGSEYEKLVTAGSTSVVVDYVPVITDLTPEAQGGDVVVDEDDLPNGSDGSDSVTQAGTFTIAAADGVETLTVGSLNVIQNGIYQGDGINITTPEGHTFTITGYNETSGVVSYTYTLNENESHDPVQGENAFFESLNVYLEDTDGDSTTDTLAAKIVDDIPAVVATAPGEISYELTITNHDYESSAGYNSSYGYYIKDENGNPTEGHVIWDGVQDAEATTATVTITGYTPDQVGFFIIPNGNNRNPDLEDGTDVTFSFVGGQWQASADGTPLVGNGSHVLFDVEELNKDGQDHVVDDLSLDGNQNWEDLQIPNGDGDFNDLNVNVEWTALSHLIVDETELTESDSTSSLSVDYSGQFTISPGADGLGSIEYALTVGGSSGLVDTATDAEVLLRVNAAGDVEGYVNDNDIVFTLTVDDAGVATLTQFRAVMHDDPTDHDETVSPATLLTGAITLSAIVTDGDGDIVSDGIDIGSLLAFEDDGPVALDDTSDTDEDAAITIDVLANDAAGADGAAITAYTQPENGTVVLNEDNTFTFTPAVNLHGQESFTYTLTDGDGDTSTATVTVNVDAVADAPTLIMSVGEEVVNITPQIIDLTNAATTDNGFEITAYNLWGNETIISTVDGTNHDGFGVFGRASGAHTEIGSTSSASERLKVEFGNVVNSVNVNFAWLSGIETAAYTFFLNDVEVGSGTTAFQSDTVDGAFTLSPVSGSAFDRMDFTAPLNPTDDYLINSITFEKVDSYSYPVTIRASLSDVDGSETLGDVTLSSLPTGVTFDGSKLTSETPLTEDQINTINASVTSTESSNSDTETTVTNAKVEFDGLDATGETADLLIEGTSGGDAIIGGEGDDIIFGKAGDDSLEGGAGADLFVWEGSDVGTIGDPAHDTVTDFNSAEDVLNLTDLLSDGSHTIEGIEDGNGDLQVNVKDSGGNVVQEIVLTDFAAGSDAAETLQTLLDNGSIDDGI